MGIMERAVTMGNNTCDLKRLRLWFAAGTTAGKNLAEEYQAGKCLGYNLGYNLGSSWATRRVTEGSKLGYNNGFVAALRNEESGGFLLPKVPKFRFAKLIAEGKVKVLLASCGARTRNFCLSSEYRGCSVDRSMLILTNINSCS